MYLNANVPFIQAYIRKEFLYNLEKHFNEFVSCMIFGVNSLPNRALGFHAMIDNGAIFWRLPIHAFVWKLNAPYISINDAQLWDNISIDISVTEFNFLKHRDGSIKLRSGQIITGEYLFTIDYATGFYAESPNEHKCSHILKLEDGNFAAMPNNRILWKDASFVVKNEKPDYITNTHVWTCEKNLLTMDDNKMFYEVKDET